MSERKSLSVIPYDPQWPDIFEQEVALIRQALGDNCLAIHHIGSTAVPGLYAKPKIDIIAVVKHGNRSIAELEGVGFAYKGEWNIPLKFGFSKRAKNSINLHVFEENHPEIEANLLFRDYLRTHPEAKASYAALKKELLADDSSHERSEARFPYYTLRKGDFIRDILRLAGFSRLRILKCTDETEWQAARRFRDTYFFAPQGIQDPYTWTFYHEEHAHLVCYHGANIVGYAHIQFWPQSRSAIRILVIDETLRQQTLGSQFLGLIEAWLRALRIKSMHVESRPSSLRFYVKNGYSPMPFEDPMAVMSSTTEATTDIPLGKIL